MGCCFSSPFDADNMKQMAGGAKTRMSMRRSALISKIEKIKIQLKQKMSGDDLSVKIKCEEMMQEERLIPCYDVVYSYLDQI